jgi:hypothetical protein
MQIHLIILVALYAKQIAQHTISGSWRRRIGLGVLTVVGVGLALHHGTVTLPYETTGGVFTIAELAGKKLYLSGSRIRISGGCSRISHLIRPITFPAIFVAQSR